jgi:FkbM family methyltransferase
MNEKLNDSIATADFYFEGQSFRITGLSESDYIFSTISKYGSFYERQFLKYFRFCVRKSGVIIDAGANIGNHSIFFSKVMLRKCISFEPNPTAYELLERNIIANNASIVAYELGLSSDTGSARLDNENIQPNNLGAARLVQDKSDKNSIEMRRLDDVLEALHPGERIAAIKIDVEGFESEMLRGAVHTLARHKPSVFIELADSHAYLSAKSILKQKGYREISVMGDTPMYHFVHYSNIFEIIRSPTWRLAHLIWRGLRSHKR